MLVVEMRSAIERLTTLGQPDVDAISVAVGIPLTRTKPDASPTDPMRYFEGTFEDGPFRAVDLRMNIKTGLVFLVLRVRKDCVVHQDEIAPHIDGTLRRVNVNPDIPPEGQVAYYYEEAGLRLAFSFTTCNSTRQSGTAPAFLSRSVSKSGSSWSSCRRRNPSRFGVGLSVMSSCFN
jgi:hypothetical protein